ncbi:DEAD/DEAH box helicase family protein [Thermogymnomonas acidicola]|uniref:DEAD/DEAH box helicase family protein n=1 Tax=Thermogymnomonas acidicola TaxID=399579 RepID=UPI0009464562|nr:DEAD/DEAH box helicase family protein [Thermogymnomonas acidicola]
MNLPYTLRTYQEEIIRFIHAKLEGGSSVAFESPTGTGKTITALVAAIEFARRKGGKKVLYVTRTNSQQEQVIKELRLLKRGGEEIRQCHSRDGPTFACFTARSRSPGTSPRNPSQGSAPSGRKRC